MVKLVDVTSKEIHGGQQHIFRFDNGYGARVVRHPYSYGGRAGLWELAVIRFIGDDDFELVYDTPVASDVLGYLSLDAVVKHLFEIADLKGETAVKER